MYVSMSECISGYVRVLLYRSTCVHVFVCMHVNRVHARGLRVHGGECARVCVRLHARLLFMVLITKPATSTGTIVTILRTPETITCPS